MLIHIFLYNFTDLQSGDKLQNITQQSHILSYSPFTIMLYLQ